MTSRPLTPRKRTPLLLAAASALLLALTACASANAETGGADGEGGTLTFAVANDPVSLNPAALGGGNDTWYITRQVYDSLVFQNPDTLEIEPWLAESFSANDDATEYTFVLRDDVTFSDGSALTAETVKGNLDSAKEAGAASGAAAPLATYVETEVVDELTLIVKFSAPNVAFPVQASSTWFGIVSDASLEVPFEERTEGTNISGSGPFVVESYETDQAVTLAAREDYAWAPAWFENDGAAQVDRVVFSVVPEAGNRTGGLTSGQIDVAGGIAPNDIDTVAATSSIVERANPGAVFGIYFNETSPITSDVAVREAVAHAVDATEVRDGALNDHFAVATSPVGALTSGHVDVSDDIAAHDPELAGEVLDAAGWVLGADGVREKDGEKLVLRFLWSQNFSANADSIAILEQQLNAVGIGVEQSSDAATALQTRQDGAYEISWANSSSAEGDVLRTLFTEGSAFSYPVADQDLVDRLDEQVTITDPEARAAALEQIQRDLVTGFHVVPVHELTTVIGTSTDVEGVLLGGDTRLTLLINATKAG